MDDPTSESEQEPDDVVLITRVSQGDTRSLEILFNRYHRLVYLVGIRVCHNEVDADALVVTVFMELWSNPHKFDPRRGSLRTYLMLLSGSRATDRVRSTKRHSERNDSSSTDLDEMPSTKELSRDPAAVLAENDLRAEVRETLCLLDDETRRVLELSFLDGMTHKEVSSSLDLPLGTVKSRIRRGLQRFREHWVSSGHAP